MVNAFDKMLFSLPKDFFKNLECLRSDHTLQQKYQYMWNTILC